LWSQDGILKKDKEQSITHISRSRIQNQEVKESDVPMNPAHVSKKEMIIKKKVKSKTDGRFSGKCIEYVTMILQDINIYIAKAFH
jgi:hypothetical protein